MGKIIIIGATGMVGAHATISLKVAGYDVIAVGKRLSDNGFFAQYGVPYISVDITKKNDFENLPIEGVDAIVHLAGVMPAKMKDYHPHDYISTIMDGTLNVLEYAVASKTKKIIFTHSRVDSNYLMGKDPIPSDIIKKFPFKGDHSIYSICKNAAVDMIEHFYHQYGIKRYVLRLPTVYGYHPNPYFYVNGNRKMRDYRWLIEEAIKGNQIEIWGDPSKAKEIVYVEDIVQLIRRSIDANVDGGMYNAGRGLAVTLEDQIRGIVQVFSNPENPSKIVYCPEKPNGREFVHDISKAKEELGYCPQYDYLQLLCAMKQEMLEEPMRLLWGVRGDYE